MGRGRNLMKTAFALNALSGLFFFIASIWQWAQSSDPNENPTLSGKGIPFIAFIPFLFGLPSFFMILEGTFGLNLEIIWKFACGLKTLVIKICTHVALILSLLFGAACLFTSISSNSVTPSSLTADPVNPDVHYFFYPLVLGGVTCMQLNIISYLLVLYQLADVEQEHEKNQNVLLTILLFPIGTVFSITGLSWFWGTSHTYPNNNYLPGVTPLVFLLPYAVLFVPFNAAVESFFNKDYLWWLWSKVCCGNKKVVIYSTCLVNLVVTVILAFFLSLLRLSTGIYVLLGLSIAIAIDTSLILFFHSFLQDTEEAEAAPLAVHEEL